jgi:type I restriction enzyme R subunit
LVPDATKLEAETRKEIDGKLEASGWAVQDKKSINLLAKHGVAVRKMDTNTGPADYTLFSVICN